MGIVGATELAPLSIVYFGVDAFYPNGVSGAKNDSIKYLNNIQTIQ